MVHGWMLLTLALPLAAGADEMFCDCEPYRWLCPTELVVEADFCLPNRPPPSPMQPGVEGLIPSACQADLDSTGQVGVGDLARVLASWGPIDGSDPLQMAADFDNDLEVGCYDLQYVMGNWATCAGQFDLNCNGVIENQWDQQTGEYGDDLAIACLNVGNDCRGDLDRNGIIDSRDIDALNCLWGTSSERGDVDDNGVVDIGDVVALLAAYGRDCRGDVTGYGGDEPDGCVCYPDLLALIQKPPG